jgi:uncharacterized protein (DUF2062 family)
VPLYVLAYGYGAALLPGKQAALPASLDLSGLMALGKPLLVGLLALACTLALLGYIAVQLAWRAWVVTAWRARARRRRERA